MEYYIQEYEFYFKHITRTFNGHEIVVKRDSIMTQLNQDGLAPMAELIQDITKWANSHFELKDGTSITPYEPNGYVYMENPACRNTHIWHRYIGSTESGDIIEIRCEFDAISQHLFETEFETWQDNLSDPAC